MAKLIILRGNSGSGKTTIAKGLQKKFGHGTMLISQDIVRREMLYVKDGEKEMRKWWLPNDLLKFIPEKLLGKELGADEIISLIYEAVLEK